MDKEILSQIQSMINPDSNNKGKFSIHDPTPDAFISTKFN